MQERLTELAGDVTRALGGALLTSDIRRRELTITTAPERIREVMTTLRDDPGLRFVSFVDLCGVDHPERTQRFDVVYHLLSPYRNMRIRVKVMVGEDEAVPSITDIFPGANWFEREAYDLYGVLFAGHPDLRRILTDYGFDGHPLRKDFPLTGFVELRYDNAVGRVVYEPVRLPQEFRTWDFLSPWEGPDYVLPGDEKAGENRQNEG